ncbi:glycoside hydrolase N-terminal domain-containing protein [Croceibacterium ferulae]|uniref:glycoside hydrolase N-terminal domain-containing protein n=1 Tax=Croceibacterium ferulae TaxID=1854641 RepID=UPI0019D4CBA9
MPLSVPQLERAAQARAQTAWSQLRPAEGDAAPVRCRRGRALWSGYPTKNASPEATAAPPEVREAIFASDYHEADRRALKLQGPCSQSYAPLGDLIVKMHHPEQAREYRREQQANHKERQC